MTHDKICFMRELDVRKVQDAVCNLFKEIAFVYPEDVYQTIEQDAENETDEKSIMAMEMIKENAHIAKEKHIPICQDTGMAIVYLTIGQEVHFYNGSLYEAVQEGVRKAYREEYLRASVVKDPLFERVNTKDNTPAIIYTELVEGEQVIIEGMAKGFGSENMSRIAMLKPAQALDGVKQFVLETIRLAGPNACPPMNVGIGIGGTFDSCAVNAKKALLRPFDKANPDEKYARLEEELKEAANALKIGPMGLHGNTTALHVSVIAQSTHIAGLPVAVNICCHASRHKKVIL